MNVINVNYIERRWNLLEGFVGEIGWDLLGLFVGSFCCWRNLSEKLVKIG